MRKLFAFDPHRSFFELKIVQITMFAGFIIAMVTSVIISVHSDLVASFDYEGFNFFVNAYKVPIGVLASLIPIIALLAANHRSVQTKEQIRVTQANSNFSNFFKHQEAFEGYISSTSKNKSKISNVKTLHKTIFPNAKAGDLAVGSEYYSYLENLGAEISEGLIKLSKDTRFDEKTDVVLELVRRTRDFGVRMSVITSIGGSGTRIRSASSKDLVVQDGDLSFALKDIAANLGDFIEFAQFDTEFSAPEELTKVCNLLKNAPKLVAHNRTSSNSFKYVL